MTKIVETMDDSLPRLTDAEMYQRVLAGDAASDGRFFFGVVTTGIYCLPSCPARKPLAGNIRFFAGVEAARAYGLRPCRRCHPDDYAQGLDALAEEMQVLVEDVRRHPGRYRDVRALVERSGYGSTRLFAMFRSSLDSTPATFLRETHLETAKRLLRETNDTVLDVALSAGFGSLSAFHERFKQATGLTPSGFRLRYRYKESR